MRTSHPVIRGGPALFALSLLAAGVPAHATAATPSHRYTVQGSLQPATTASGGTNGASMQLSSRLSTPTQDVPAQSGGDFVVMAKLATSPMACAADTVFVDGFDGP